jgi:hypothetical protein
MAGKPVRWTQWFFSDWRNDAGVRSVSLEARGLWIDMLALMDESPRRGYLQQANGRPMTVEQLAIAAGSSAVTVSRLLQELEDAGVYSSDATKTIYNRRMTRDLSARERGACNRNVRRLSRHGPANVRNGQKTGGSISLGSDSSVSLSEDPIQDQTSNAKTLGRNAEELYRLYPRKVGKKDALKAILKALKECEFEALREAVQEYATSPEGRGQYCPHPATWFNKGRWHDDRREWQKSGGKSSSLRSSLDEAEHRLQGL